MERMKGDRVGLHPIDASGLLGRVLWMWSSSVRRDAEGIERRVAYSPLPQHLPSEGPVRRSHLVPKTSLDGGDAALARSGPAGGF
jgi:hypothetical protein